MLLLHSRGPQTPADHGGAEGTQNHPLLPTAARCFFPCCTVQDGATATSKKGTLAGAAVAGDLPSQTDRLLSPILCPAIPHSDTQRCLDSTGGTSDHGEGYLWDIIAGLPTKQDLHDMATSIVNVLSQELHDLRPTARYGGGECHCPGVLHHYH